jgi:hypothetical protein
MSKARFIAIATVFAAAGLSLLAFSRLRAEARPPDTGHSPQATVLEALRMAAATTVPRMDFNQGTFIVAFLSATCATCEEDFKTLNDYADSAGLPPIVALMFGDGRSIAQIRDNVQPTFPTLPLEAAPFFKLIGNAPPRIYLMRDGQPVTFWDEIPPIEELASGEKPASAT